MDEVLMSNAFLSIIIILFLTILTFQIILNKRRRLMHLKLGETSNVIVSSPELAKQFLKTHDLHFATRPHLPSASIIFYNARDIVFGGFGEYWRQMRKICTFELLSEHRVKLLRPVREEKIGELVKSIRL